MYPAEWDGPAFRFDRAGGGNFGGGGASGDYSGASSNGDGVIGELASGAMVSARTAVRVVREGWLSAAVRLTWKPLLGALFCAVLLGATIDHFIPAAHSLPQAINLIHASRQVR
jgi:hypothetical protein